VLVTGGIGVLVVVAFVASIVFERNQRVGEGDRIAVAASSEAGLPPAVLVGRCEDERVRAVEVRAAGGDVLWRIESDKGTIDRGFVIGSAPPPFFDTVVQLDGPLPGGPLEAVVAIDDDIVDRETFEVASLEGGDGIGVSCGDRSLGLVPLVFVVGAAGVVVAYASMVARFLKR